MKTLFKSNKHLTKSFYTIVVSLVFALFLLLSASLYSNYQNKVNRAKDQTFNLAITLAEYINGIVSRVDLSLERTKYYIEKKNLKLENAKIEDFDALLAIKKEVPEIEIITVFDETGSYRLNSLWPERPELHEKQKKINVADRAYFLEHKNSSLDELNISEPIFSRTTNNQVIVLSRKIFDKNKVFSGLVAATINLEKISEFFRRIDIGPRGEISLFNANRVLLARTPQEQKFIGKVIPIESAMQLVRYKDPNKGSYEGPCWEDHVNRLFSFRNSTKTGLSVVVGIAKEDIVQNWIFESFTLVMLFLLLVAISIFALYRQISYMDQIEVYNERLFKSEKLSSLGELAAGIGHEIKNPLSVIAGRSGLLIKEIQNEKETGTLIDRDRIISNLDSVQRMAGRINKILDSLKAYSRNSDQDPMQKVCFKKMAEEAIVLMTERFKKFDVTFISNLGPDGNLVNCRESQIVQVLINLINNSIDAIADLQKREINISVKKSGAFIVFEIVDSGPPIPQDIRSKIMEAFFTTKPVGLGTGLGLSISKKIIEDHGGELSLDSDTQVNRFVVKLPFAV